MRGGNRGGGRRSTPKVKNGKVQKKNRWEQSPNIYLTPSATLRIDRRSARKGHRHLLDRHDIERFVAIIPNWNDLSRGLNAVVLAEPEDDTSGYHVPGVIHVCPWNDELWMDYRPDFFDAHKDVFDQFAVPYSRLEEDGEQFVRCYYTEETAKAWQLLHIFLHELGHHVDRISTKKKERALRGEEFAENFALRLAREILPRYIEVFRPSFARDIKKSK